MPRFTVRELVDGGDWACAHGDPEALAQVASALATMLEPRFAELAGTVAAMTRDDLLRASELWGTLTRSLRPDDGGPAPQ